MGSGGRPSEAVCLRIAPRTNRRKAQSGRSCEARADLDEDTAAPYAEIRADLKRRGELIGANDLFIAAHARRPGLVLVLVTANVRDFSRAGGLSVENRAA